MNKHKANIINKDEGKQFWVLGDLYTFKITGKETDNSLAVVEQVIQPQSGPPPHIHLKEDEAFYILEGKFSFLVEDKLIEAQAGSFVYVPKGILHTFRNSGDSPGKLMVTISPAGLENFFYEIGTPVTESDAPPPVDGKTIERVMQLATKYSMEVRMGEK